MRFGRQDQLKMSANRVNNRRTSGLVIAAFTFYVLLALGSLGGSSATSINNTQLDLNGRRSFSFGVDTTRDRDNYDNDVANQNTSVSLYKEPSSLLVNILKEFFTDIDWQAIENARVQIEKFIHKVDRIVGSFRTIISKATNGGGGGGGAGSQASSRTRDGRWWTGSGEKKNPGAADTTNVKEMLERVACYVGYVRLMNLSNEALAELDASKMISNLFGGNSAASGGGNAKRNASVWSWLG